MWALQCVAGGERAAARPAVRENLRGETEAASDCAMARPLHRNGCRVSTGPPPSKLQRAPAAARRTRGRHQPSAPLADLMTTSMGRAAREDVEVDGTWQRQRTRLGCTAIEGGARSGDRAPGRRRWQRSYLGGSRERPTSALPSASASPLTSMRARRLVVPRGVGVAPRARVPSTLTPGRGLRTDDTFLGFRVLQRTRIRPLRGLAEQGAGPPRRVAVSSLALGDLYPTPLQIDHGFWRSSASPPKSTGPEWQRRSGPAGQICAKTGKPPLADLHRSALDASRESLLPKAAGSARGVGMLGTRRG